MLLLAKWFKHCIWWCPKKASRLSRIPTWEKYGLNHIPRYRPVNLGLALYSKNPGNLCHKFQMNEVGPFTDFGEHRIMPNANQKPWLYTKWPAKARARQGKSKSPTKRRCFSWSLLAHSIWSTQLGFKEQTANQVLTNFVSQMKRHC